MQHPYRKKRLHATRHLRRGVHDSRIDTIVARNRCTQIVLEGMAHAFFGAVGTRFRIFVIALGNIARQIRDRERFHLVEIVRLDRIHVPVGHFRRTVNGNSLEIQIARTIGLVDRRTRYFLITRAIGALVAALKRATSFNRTIVKPERHIYALDMLDFVRGDKFLWQEPFTLVIVIQRSNRSVFVEFERHHTIGACHVDERARGHCGVAAIWAFRNRSRCIARNLRATRRACHRPQTVALAFVPRSAREKRRNGPIALACVAACRGSGIQHILRQGHRNAVGCTHGLKRAHLAGSRTLGCGHRRRIGLRLLGGIVRLNLRNFKRTFTVVADHEAFRLRKMQGSTTCGALVVHRFDSHENSYLLVVAFGSRISNAFRCNADSGGQGCRHDG